tara:strand:+ start:162 stop:404 length:243 start_codon:yes stop_codon:yes gene_type:complete
VAYPEIISQVFNHFEILHKKGAAKGDTEEARQKERDLATQKLTELISKTAFENGVDSDFDQQVLRDMVLCSEVLFPVLLV